MDMHQYLVVYRSEVAEEYADARSFKAHRVEGWSEDYAFFGHTTRMDVVTRLIPRRIVREVSMVYDDRGDPVGHEVPMSSDGDGGAVLGNQQPE